MPPKRRSTGRTSARSRRSAPIPVPVEDDESAPSVHGETPVPTPKPEDPEEEDEEEFPDAGEELQVPEDPATPAQDDNGEEDEEDSAPVRPSSRTRRGGRAGKPMRGTRRSDWDIAGTPEPVPEDASDAGSATPRRGRGRGRGHRGGFRGRLKANRGPSHITQLPMDKEGNVLDVQDDEVVQPEDVEGETKVDKEGHLLGGREYRVRTFKIAGRGEKLFMLSTEPARCTGFRDSYLFFAKHPHLFKIIVNETEKRDMIDRDIIPHSYKGRAIGVVTARSVYREFGSKIVINGKKITDDYKVTAARERGDKEGELADSTDAIAPPGRTYNRSQGMGFPIFPNAKGIMGTKPRKALITDTNWMLEHALAASRFNSALTFARKPTFDGVYDIHLNAFSYPEITQPTHARWERMASPPPPLPSADARKRKFEEMNGDATLTNGHTPLVPPHINGTRYSSSPEMSDTDTTPAPTPDDPAPSLPSSKLFQPLSNVLTRNFLIVDTLFSTPPSSSFGAPGPPTLPLNPLTNTRPGVPALTEEEMEAMELDPESRQALREAQRSEQEWRSAWGREVESGCRGRPKCGVGM